MKTLCANCGENLDRKPGELRKSKSGRAFCDQSCAAIYNNKMYPKRVMDKLCQCGTPIASNRTRCRKCSSVLRQGLPEHATLAYFLSKPNNGSRYSRVRDYAKLTLSHLPRVCQNCGYDKHVHTCHIKGIASFDITATLNEVNDPSNLVLLCPNCHWELDNGLLNGRCWNRTNFESQI